MNLGNAGLREWKQVPLQQALSEPLYDEYTRVRVHTHTQSDSPKWIQLAAYSKFKWLGTMDF